MRFEECLSYFRYTYIVDTLSRCDLFLVEVVFGGIPLSEELGDAIYAFGPEIDLCIFGLIFMNRLRWLEA